MVDHTGTGETGFSGRYAAALYALAFEQKVLGENHPNVAAALNDLAALYEAENKLGQAEELYLRSLKIREKAVGPECAFAFFKGLPGYILNPSF